MPKYVIERNLPGAGRLSPAELEQIAARSNGVLRELGPDIQWVHSYVTADTIYCVYRAASADLVREHARRGGFPADRVSEVASVIHPGTASGEP